VKSTGKKTPLRRDPAIAALVASDLSLQQSEKLDLEIGFTL
jgi:hypothetical protein